MEAWSFFQNETRQTQPKDVRKRLSYSSNMNGHLFWSMKGSNLFPSRPWYHGSETVRAGHRPWTSS